MVDIRTVIYLVNHGRVVPYRGKSKGEIGIEVGLSTQNLDGTGDRGCYRSWESDKICSHVAKVAGDVTDSSLRDESQSCLSMCV